ncbi:MAG: HNH endonuclease [Bdellovibrionaceae bacterium]|nr:HNH endonuclease [Pseudobdellovibrionaceae bacterium]
MTNAELIRNFEKLVQVERRVTRKLLEHIAEIESCRAYLDLGYDGMYAYLTKGLGYSEGAAYRRLQAARVLKVAPSVAEKVEAGTLNLTQLAEVAKVSRQTKLKPTAELFAKLETRSKAATEQIVAQAFDVSPRSEVHKRTQRDHSVRLEITFSAEQFAAVEKARGLLSHICPEGAWPEVFVELARRYSEKFEARESQRAKPTASVEAKAAWVPLAGRRRSIPASQRRLIFLRAGGCCEHVDLASGRRCGSAYQPQVDHIQPVARGGTNDPANLQLLCGSHNRAKGFAIPNRKS